MADLGTRLTCAHKAQPGWIGPRIGLSDHFNHIAVLQFGAQWHRLLIDHRRDRAIADAGVYAVRKINDRRASGQRANLTAWRKHVHRIGKQIDLDVLNELQ